MRRIVSVYMNDYDKPLIGRFVALNARQARNLIRKLKQELLVLNTENDYIVEQDLEDDLDGVIDEIKFLERK